MALTHAVHGDAGQKGPEIQHSGPAGRTKLVIKLYKLQEGQNWANLGSPLVEMHNVVARSRYQPCKIADVSRVTHDSLVFTLIPDEPADAVFVRHTVPVRLSVQTCLSGCLRVCAHVVSALNVFADRIQLSRRAVRACTVSHALSIYFSVVSATQECKRGCLRRAWASTCRYAFRWMVARQCREVTLLFHCHVLAPHCKIKGACPEPPVPALQWVAGPPSSTVLAMSTLPTKLRVGWRTTTRAAVQARRRSSCSSRSTPSAPCQATWQRSLAATRCCVPVPSVRFPSTSANSRRCVSSPGARASRR